MSVRFLAGQQAKHHTRRHMSLCLFCNLPRKMHCVKLWNGATTLQPWQTPSVVCLFGAGGSTCPGTKLACTNSFLPKAWHPRGPSLLVAPHGQMVAKLQAGHEFVALLLVAPLLPPAADGAQHWPHHQYLHKSLLLLGRGAMHWAPSPTDSCFLQPWHIKACNFLFPLVVGFT